jgi:hypothetical protein
MKKASEKNRLEELENYEILDTPTEKDFDELVFIASAVFDTPISLISLVDDHRQWFKARIGLEPQQTPRSDAFCQHAIANPYEVLVVQDPVNDVRFSTNPLVLGDPNIRFYAGAPLVTPNGNVLGTLCVIDNKPREFTKTQEKALKMLASKAMDSMEQRKRLKQQDHKIISHDREIQKLTDNVPGIIYQFRMEKNGEIAFPFISAGIEKLHPSLSSEKAMTNPYVFFNVIPKEDEMAIRRSVTKSYYTNQQWYAEFRIIQENETVEWYAGTAQPELKENGTMIWYGTFQNITHKKEYEQALEQIIFDISHVIRRPVSTLVGLSEVLAEKNMEPEKFQKFLSYLNEVTKELEDFTKNLNEQYVKKKLNFSRKKL